jgi:hypothetical protein
MVQCAVTIIINVVSGDDAHDCLTRLRRDEVVKIEIEPSQ